jgi:hypothetical protein
MSKSDPVSAPDRALLMQLLLVNLTFGGVQVCQSGIAETTKSREEAWEITVIQFQI